ncbi:MAG: sigma-54-dependent Fis family transcriptional regulator [Calditrichaeota bacterium]|nr:sigma-54-dependent Fis family transcriptional regulator [Calditrichota bacterium]
MNILIVDDEEIQRNILADILKDAGYNADTAGNGAIALEKLAADDYSIVLTDLKMPEKDGIDVLNGVRDKNPDTQVIIMTAFGTIPGAVNAIKKGAYDYLTKPFKKDELLQVVKRAAEKFDLLQENLRLRNEINSRYQFENIIGKSAAMQKIFSMIERISKIDSTVLISGASGTGKELVARAIHFNGNRKNGPFIALNCGAIPESLIESELFGHEKGTFTGASRTHIGKFEQAQGGSIFLDEIGTMRPDLQIRLLRVLQEKRIERLGAGAAIELDVRVMAATNENLDSLIQQNKFRMDLYHRLNVFNIHIPELKDRREDIILLAKHFINKYAEKFNRPVPVLSPKSLSKLENYSFPGNVRELENIIEKTLILCDLSRIEAEDLMINNEGLNQSKITHPDSTASLTDVEYQLIYDALSDSRGSIKDASKKLGISYKTLQYRMRKFSLNKTDFK